MSKGFRKKLSLEGLKFVLSSLNCVFFVPEATHNDAVISLFALIRADKNEDLLKRKHCVGALENFYSFLR